jgi:hypothetical protein
MKVSFKTGHLDTKAMLRVTGVLQGAMLKTIQTSVGKGRLKSFRLEYEDLIVTFPPKDGEFTVEL